jgi:hypothetical protein
MENVVPRRSQLIEMRDGHSRNIFRARIAFGLRMCRKTPSRSKGVRLFLVGHKPSNGDTAQSYGVVTGRTNDGRLPTHLLTMIGLFERGDKFVTLPLAPIRSLSLPGWTNVTSRQRTNDCC